MTSEAATYTLGSTDIAVTPVGLGCWQFSRSRGLAGGYWDALPQETVRAIVEASLEGGINWFDTAEVYGNGASEESLAEALRALGVERERFVIADKWFPAFRFAPSIEKTFPAREKALGGISIDLHQIHQPFSFSSVEKQIAHMAALVGQGRIRAVGVSNFNADRMRRAHARLATDGLFLASNQMRYSLIDREIERDGVLEAADELGVSIIAYSPLAQGILTGKFHGGDDIRARRGPRKWLKRFKPEGLEATRPLVEELEAVAAAHQATAAQVALAWATQRHGQRIVAIPGASSVSQARSNAQALSVTLSAEELDRLGDAGREAERKLKGT
jgi:aryl-alcohol dehydrogenase-like predicted oxidoreductase